MIRLIYTFLMACMVMSSSVWAAGEIVLSKQDVKTYKELFAAHKKGDIKKTKTLQKQVKNPVLMGYVLYDRYFSSSYQCHPKELTTWMDNHNDLAVAPDIYALGRQKKATFLGKKPKDIFGGKSGACGFVLKEEPIDLIKGRLFSRLSGEEKKQARFLMKQIAKNIESGKRDAALDLIEGGAAGKIFNAEEMDSAKTALAFSYFLAGEDKQALKLAQSAARRSEKEIPLASWTAGLVSWRQGDISDAAGYFETVAELDKTYPLLRASSAFWAARAHMRLGNFKKVGDYMELSSEYPRTFYGFLSMQLLGQDVGHVWEMPTSTSDDVFVNFSHPALTRFYALRQVGQNDLAKRELTKLYIEADKDAKAVLLMISEKNGFSDELLAVSGNLSGEEDTRYPAPKWTPKDGWKVDKALVYSFVKQESCFNMRAQSSVGAMGLMQIMPGTGKELARDLQYSWDPRKMREPAYNLSLGQNYLKQLMAHPEVNNNLIFTAVSYNAGPGNLSKWKKKMDYQNDPLLFIESIPSKETRSFVERIMVNYWVYRALMGQPAASLEEVGAGKWPIYRSHDSKVL